MATRLFTKASRNTPIRISEFSACPKIKKPFLEHAGVLFLLLALLLLNPTQSLAGIQFQEVSRAAGISGGGTTFGASVGDFNGDGWPDLWVGNHNTAPSLYLNHGDGTFLEIAHKVWAADPEADTHGAAWADFDNDGDQDLIELVDVVVGDALCIGCGRNHMFINEDGALKEQAHELGLDAPLGQARTPLWFDADGDGRLDVLVNNKHGKIGYKAPSIIYRQSGDGFVASNDAFKFRLTKGLSRMEKIRYALDAAMRLKFERPSFLRIYGNMGFAQLADLTGDGRMELIAYDTPTRVYTLNNGEFENITGVIGFPNITDVTDAAIADFNGDSRLDLYLTVGPPPYVRSEVVQSDLYTLKGSIDSHDRKIDSHNAKTVQFRTEGEVGFQIYPSWFSLSNVFIGSVGANPIQRSFSLSPDDPSVKGPTSSAAINSGGLSIEYDPASQIWSVRNTAVYSLVDFIVRSNEPIKQVKTTGFTSFEEEGVDRLLLRQSGEYIIKRLSEEAGAETSCHSVVTGDFDNDMDLDLYLVCAGPVANLPNRLYKNDGNANFTVVTEAGGAAGSTLGRGDVVVTMDYDRDGFLDLFITNGFDPTSPFVEDGPHQLFRNLGNHNHWLEVDLVGTTSNRDGIGTVVEIEAGGVKQVRGQGGGIHLNSQNHQRIHFGLGTHTKVDRLILRWPSGIVQEIEDIKADQILRIKEQSFQTSDSTGLTLR